MCPESRRLAYLWLKKAVRPQGIYAHGIAQTWGIRIVLDRVKIPDVSAKKAT